MMSQCVEGKKDPGKYSRYRTILWREMKRQKQIKSRGRKNWIQTKTGALTRGMTRRQIYKPAAESSYSTSCSLISNWERKMVQHHRLSGERPAREGNDINNLM